MTAREERRAGLRPDQGWVFVLTAALVAWGCGPDRKPDPPAPAIVTPEGVTVVYTPFPRLDLAAALREIRYVVPDADPRIHQSVRGVPAGTLVEIRPAPWPAPYSPTGWAAGEWWPVVPRRIVVAWRWNEADPRLLPALSHELRHMLTRDPLAGH